VSYGGFEVIAQADVGDQGELGLQPVDALLGVVLDFLQVVAANEVAALLAVPDGQG
jgi:hypothetical protein